MVGNAGATSVEPVLRPSLQKAKRRRLINLTKEQIAKEQVAGRTGPLRQIRYRDEVVSPLALERECRKLLRRTQRAIATIVTSKVYAGDLRDSVLSVAASLYKETPEQLNTAANDAQSLATKISQLCV